MIEDQDETLDFIATARKRFAGAAEDEKEVRTKFIADLKLSSPDGDDQWDPIIKMQREQAGRPAMAFPRCHTFVQQVANEARQNKPQVKFAPRLDSDQDTAEVYEGLARFIQYTSDAQVAYETAIEYSAGGSFGYYRFLTDYIDDDSDDLDLKIVQVVDPLAIYGVLIPACFNRKPRFAFVTEDIPKEEYKALYPGTEMVSLGWEEAGRRAEGWVGSDSVRIAEYWWIEEEKAKGKRRPKCKVRFCKINGLEKLPDSDTEWPGSCIPIVPVLGKKTIIDGKPRIASVVRSQKSAQQMLNYAKTRIAETVSLAPISPFMIAEGQIAGYEAQWSNLNRESRPFLTYKPIAANGQPVGPPQRQVQESPIQALSAFVAQEVDDMKATTGIYDASMGAQSNETTGKAIQARAESANLTIMHFLDNLERSFRQAGNIIEELIPLIYDTAREVTILGPDEKAKVVLINKEHAGENGETQHYKIAGNRVPLVVTMGRAYDTKRMETFAFMQELARSVPQIVPIIGDIMMHNSDMAGAEQAAERMHKMLPPQLQDSDSPLPPEAQAAVAQAQQQIQGMQGKMAELEFEKRAKIVEHQGKLQQIDAESRAAMALEQQKLENQLAIAEVEAKAQNASERTQFVRDMWAQFHEQAHDIASQAAEQAHERAMGAMQAQQQQELQQQAAQNSSAQSAQDAAQSQAAFQ